ncbi:hypothetical protein, partial [Pseudoalteromonas sp. APC 3691]|uniref:hypothetical protein n=1 Tax=Pseudoalteromonas sp. APC 3691 TaxID=3035173 RepID=UPI0025B5CE0A
GFLQTPPLASDALAIQIIFPLVRVIRHLSAYRVCQLRWANKNKKRILRFLFIIKVIKPQRRDNK